MSNPYQTADLVFAIVSVAGATATCATRGDVATVETLASYYALVADGVRRSRGEVIKVIGDGVIVVFPASQARDAVNDLRSVQEQGTALWKVADERCFVQVKVGIGSLIRGLFGPPGQERDDVYGDALNQFFKLPAGDFVIAPSLSDRQAPAEMEEVTLPPSAEPQLLSRIIVTAGLSESNKDAQRVIAQGGVLVDDAKISDPRATLDATSGKSYVLKVGKRRFGRVKFE
jgi:hypothetical protein